MLRALTTLLSGNQAVHLLTRRGVEAHRQGWFAAREIQWIGDLHDDAV